MFPLGCGQRWLAAFARHDPAMARPVQRVYRLRDGVRTADLLGAARHVVAAHPALRLRLERRDGQLGQRFDDTPAQIEAVSVQGRTPAQRATYAHHLFLEDARRIPDLEREPPLRLRLVEVDGELFLGVTVDHLAADDIAMDLFEQELDAAWAREAAGADHPDADGLPYLAALEREAVRPAEEDANLAWWRDELHATPLATRDVPLAWADGSTARWQVTGPDFDRLVGACRAARIPVSAAVAAAQLAWWRSRDSTDDLVVNLPVSNRVLPEEQSWIANLSMLLHVRFRPDLDAARLTDVRDTLLEAMRHRHYDYGSLSEAVTADASARGGRVSWLTGISYLIVRRPSPVGGRLLAERLDAQPGQPVTVPQGSFSLEVREGGDGLQFGADWDHATWGGSPQSIEQEFTYLLNSLTKAAGT